MFSFRFQLYPVLLFSCYVRALVPISRRFRSTMVRGEVGNPLHWDVLVMPFGLRGSAERAGSGKSGSHSYYGGVLMILMVVMRLEWREDL